MEAKLVVVGGKANKSEIKLKLPAMLGRGRDADVTVAHATVSRQHCLIYELDGALVVRDNGSLNGTVVDGQRIKESVLKPGQTLTIGPLTFRADYEHIGEFPVLSDAPSAAAEGNGVAAPSDAKPAKKPAQATVADRPKEPAEKKQAPKVKAPPAEVKPQKPSSDEFDFLDEEEPAEAEAPSGSSFSFLNDSDATSGAAANGSGGKNNADDASEDNDDSAEVFRIADDPPAAKPAKKETPAQNKPAGKSPAAASKGDDSALNDFLNSLGLEE